LGIIVSELTCRVYRPGIIDINCKEGILMMVSEGRGGGEFRRNVSRVRRKMIFET
jgi:hypothetical protein